MGKKGPNCEHGVSGVVSGQDQLHTSRLQLSVCNSRHQAKGGAPTLCVRAAGVWQKLKGEVGAVCGGLRHGRCHSMCSQVLQRGVLRLQEGSIVWAGVGAWLE